LDEVADVELDEAPFLSPDDPESDDPDADELEPEEPESFDPDPDDPESPEPPPDSPDDLTPEPLGSLSFLARSADEPLRLSVR
jgi:hypothetical protein